MTGVPVVCVGHGRGGVRFEPPDLLQNGETGLVSDDLDELRHGIETLMADYDAAAAIGERGRKVAIELFSAHTVLPQWRRLLLDRVSSL